MSEVNWGQVVDVVVKLLPLIEYGLGKLDDYIKERRKQKEEDEKKLQEEEKKRRQEEEKKKRFMARQMDPKEEMGLSPDQLENYLQCGGSRGGFLMGLQCYSKGDITSALTYFIRGYNLDHNIDCSIYIAKIQMEEREFSKALPFLEECLNHLKANQRDGRMMFNICEAIWVCHVNIGGEEHIKAAIPLLENSASRGVLEAQIELAEIFATNDEFCNLTRALELCQVVVQQIASQPMVNQEMVTKKMNPAFYFHYLQLMIGKLILQLDLDPNIAIQHLGLAMNGGDETINGKACFLTVIAYKRLREHAHEMKESCKSHRKRRQWKKEERHDREMEKHFMRMGASFGNTKCMAVSENARDLLAAAQHGDLQAMFRYGHLIQKTKPREGARFIQQAAIQDYQPTEEDEEFVRSLASDDESDSESGSDSTSESESESGRESDCESESDSESQSKRKPRRKPKRKSDSDSDSESQSKSKRKPRRKPKSDSMSDSESESESESKGKSDEESDS